MPPLLERTNRPTQPQFIQTPPSAARIYALLPLWIIYYLFSIIESKPRYESSLYGAWNIFLHAIFTQTRHFVIIPQALIREAITEGDDIDEDLGNISISSTGAVCHGRDEGT